MRVACKVSVPLVTLLALIVGGCATHKHTMAAKNGPIEKKLIGEIDRGWLRYRFYRQPAFANSTESEVKNGNHRKAGGTEITFSIMVVNMTDGTSPLRKLSSNLDQYNIYYEYLLNQTKNDLALVIGDETLYPVYYAFENNYNAFPFETINVGYRSEHPFTQKMKRSTTARLIYADRVFAHDTVSCPVSL